jgi:hypothetical protein
MAGDDVTLVREADSAASRGDLVRARTLLEAAVAGASADVDTHLRLAAICRAGGDPRSALGAAEAALAVDPLHFVALLLRADLLERAGSPEAGEGFARALAQRPDGALPPHLEAMTRHAEQRSAAHRATTLASLEAAVPPRRALSPDQEARLARFRSNAVHATRVYHCEPTDYHYPGLIEREFHDRGGFDWIAALEAATDVIAAEFAAVAAAERVELVPYIQYPEHQPLRQWKALNNSPDWSAIHLVRNAAIVAANARHCPETMALIANLPQPKIPGVSPNAMFSLLAPGARIPPHTGVANTRLVCHLPLVVPDGCWFRVGAERRDWKRGVAWVFDDTIEHEAANESASLRVILIVDVWHPGLDANEREAVAATIDAHARRTGHGL